MGPVRGRAGPHRQPGARRRGRLHPRRRLGGGQPRLPRHPAGSGARGAADTRPIVASSRDLGERIAGNFVRVTGSAPSNYVGDGTGLVTREDLGGLNLSTVPKVFIECANMRDGKDAARVTSDAWRQKAAQGISDGIVNFLQP
uniref:MurNAc-LAA domain-containing protein n=1 Tax=Streptomyces avermitilis TaxID=33903 RepID=A0A499W1P8_STRAX|nr:hypothetical protein SAVMC3_66850 [Streptomyces avermitilis]